MPPQMQKVADITDMTDITNISALLFQAGANLWISRTEEHEL